MDKKNKFISTFIIVLITLLIGGTSVFAEKSVPGDLLYNVKIFVNEPVAGIFALSKEEKTEWMERLVERRLDEVQKLVFENKLDEITRVSLESQVKNQIDLFTTNVNQLALKKGESINSSNLNIRLQASLRAYQNVLEKLSAETSMSENIKQETDKFIVMLLESQNKVKEDSGSLESNVGVDLQVISTTTVPLANSVSALAKQNAATSLLNSVKLFYQKEKINLSANIQNQINTKFALAETNLEEGKVLYNSSIFVKATEKFQAVISEVNSAKLLMLSNIIKNDIRYNHENDDEEDDIEED